ncbi:MAG: putative glycoside hydrolase [Candidatus Bipolaricaulaceae bacterium]
MAGNRRRNFAGALLLALALAGAVWPTEAPTPPPQAPPPAPASPPAPTGRRGIYLTSYALTRPGFLEETLAALSRHGLDTLVINVKNMHGEVCYPTRVQLAHAAGAVHPRLDVPAILAAAHRAGAYVVARQVVFYDPALAGHLGSSVHPWVLPTQPQAVAYNLELAAELESLGFDEIQFDYIRFPDDGPIGGDYSHRCAAVEAFLAQARERLSLPISADVFGRVLWPWNANRSDPIGQHLEGMSSHVDVLSPMVYPSHYVEGELKADPYGTVRRALRHGMDRVDVPLRPFLQAFAMAIPPGMTLPQYILAQIRACHELGTDGYLFWNPGADYTALWEALTQLGGPD